jgi:hypothetical protein
MIPVTRSLLVGLASFSSGYIPIFSPRFHPLDDHFTSTALPRPWGVHPDPVIFGVVILILAA